uniref:Uncharacterized protein n=1 Tax=Trichogramma kaykai TaxID=54128 RepID=A0ABD2W051_9HYME
MPTRHGAEHELHLCEDDVITYSIVGEFASAVPEAAVAAVLAAGLPRRRIFLIVLRSEALHPGDPMRFDSSNSRLRALNHSRANESMIDACNDEDDGRDDAERSVRPHWRTHKWANVAKIETFLEIKISSTVWIGRSRVTQGNVPRSSRCYGQPHHYSSHLSCEGFNSMCSSRKILADLNAPTLGCPVAKQNE